MPQRLDCGLELAQRFERMYTADLDVSVRTNIVRMLTAVSKTVAEPTARLCTVSDARPERLKLGVVNYALCDVARHRVLGALRPLTPTGGSQDQRFSNREVQ